jgi:hypothetical protein
LIWPTMNGTAGVGAATCCPRPHARLRSTDSATPVDGFAGLADLIVGGAVAGIQMSGSRITISSDPDAPAGTLGIYEVGYTGEVRHACPLQIAEPAVSISVKLH